MDKQYVERFKESRLKNSGIREKLLKRGKAIDEVEFITKAKEVEKEKKSFSKISVYSPFVRVNKEKREVTGIASNETIDSYGDIVRYDAIKEAMPEYMKFGNIREMHESKAAGIVKDFKLNDKDKELEITVKVIDDMAWKKVIEGVYKGFSIGGEILESIARMIISKDENGNEIEMHSGGKDITLIKLIEISLVDRPANPEALISSYKMASENKFVPDRVLIPNEELLKKYSSELTKSKSVNNIETSHLKLKKGSKNILINKNMDKKSTFEKAWDKTLEFFKKESIDLSDFSDDNTPITLSKNELMNIVKDSVEAAVFEKKGEEVVIEKKNEAKIDKSDKIEINKNKAKEIVSDDKIDNESKTPKDKIKEVSNNFIPMMKAFEKMTEMLEKQILSNEKVFSEVNKLSKMTGVSTQSEDIKLSKTVDSSSFKGLFQ